MQENQLAAQIAANPQYLSSDGAIYVQYSICGKTRGVL